jgi:non-heme chloroperoxidase
MKKIHKEYSAHDGEKLHLYEIGQGEPVIYLHGWSSSHDPVVPLMKALATQYRVIAWDTRGHGRHPYHADTPVTVEQVIDDLDTMLNFLELKSVRLIGHSMGAALAWAYMRKYGWARIQQTVIVDMTPKLATDDAWKYGVYFDFPPAKQKWLADLMQNDFADAVLQLCAYGHNETTRKSYESNDVMTQLQRQYLKSLKPQPLIALWNDLVKQDFRELLQKLPVPTLLVYGGKSQFYGKALADWMHNTLASSELLFMPEADHSPFVQDFGLVINTMLAFFAKTDQREV